MLASLPALITRLEQHEAWSSLEHARTQAQRHPETGAAWLAVAGGYAIYLGQKSPANQVYGALYSGALDTGALDTGALDSGALDPGELESALRQICEFYHSRRLPARLRLPETCAARLQPALEQAGFRLEKRMDIFVRSLAAPLETSSLPAGVEIRPATPAEARRWFELDEAGGDWAEPDGISFMLVRSVYKSATQLFLAWQDGQPAAGGALELHAGVASLMAASTRPAYRRGGLHSALVNARLQAAQAAGCDLAMVQARPEAASVGNIQRAGFRRLYQALELSTSRT